MTVHAQGHTDGARGIVGVATHRQRRARGFIREDDVTVHAQGHTDGVRGTGSVTINRQRRAEGIIRGEGGLRVLSQRGR